MSRRRRHIVLLGCLAGALAVSLGAAERGAAHEVEERCAGKQICVSIGGQDFASRSADATETTPAKDRYLSASVKIRNGSSTANLVNVTLTVRWSDGAETTSRFEPDFSGLSAPSGLRCTGAAGTLTCTTPKSLGPLASETYPLVFRTATHATAAATTLIATAAAKEQSKPTKGGAPPNDASVQSLPHETRYESPVEQDISTAGDGISVTLATAQTGRQFSTLPVPAGANRGIFEVLESEYPEGSCPDGLTCFGQQHVTTTATGVSPVNLRITYTGPIPPGLTEGNLKVLHLRDGDTVATVIDTACIGSTLFSGVQPTNIPCRTVRITRGFLPGGIAKVEIDAWDLFNGEWDFS